MALRTDEDYRRLSGVRHPAIAWECQDGILRHEGAPAMGILAFLILGLLAGAIAKAILPGPDPGGILLTMVIGVVGAMLGGFLGGLLFDIDPVDEFFSLSTWLAAIIGSIILLLIYRMVAGKSSNTSRR